MFPGNVSKDGVALSQLEVAVNVVGQLEDRTQPTGYTYACTLNIPGRHIVWHIMKHTFPAFNLTHYEAYFSPI